MMKQQKVKILAIESSCDETAAAVVEDGRKVLSNVISSQIEIHTVYGGVVPEIASRKHLEAIDGVIGKALADSSCTWDDIDAIAVTQGPGLVGALLVGVSEAKSLAYALHKPLIGVHHIEGHIAANYISDPEWQPPFLCLVISGGHTYLCIVEDYGVNRMLGETRDDAAGEAFDKVARAIGLGYPGGPKLQKAALEGNPEAFHFPRPCLEEEGYDFSFSGLKSAVLNTLNHLKMTGEAFTQADIAASFQAAVTDVLVGKTMQAAGEYGIRRVAMAGGVSANAAIRKAMQEACDFRGITLSVPSISLCTDNAAMIGSAAYFTYLRGDFAGPALNAEPDMPLLVR
ncbi:MAG: tRNA (adenosine(37)-N6)-threonylcarbamoyltransferase complex transferase subunit TsaD [Firmicutes bacterium]|nr:tRNA (adenosine(37)-N6)-threonylcarbamoyltransferase complex transferase subunit TsaD [Bacillota bacterium]